MTAASTLPPARQTAADLLRLGVAGMRARPLRAVLASLGIAIGIASMVAVVGISSSSQADLLRQLDRLGTNLLTVKPGQSLSGENAELPPQSLSMVGRVAGVDAASAVGDLKASVYRTDQVPAEQTGGISVRAVTLDLPVTLRGTLDAGTWLNEATARYPTTVLGSIAAEQLGIDSPGAQVWLGERWFTVLGVLAPVPLAPGLDRAALVGWSVAVDLLAFDGHPTTIYVRSAADAVPTVRALLPRTVNPEYPEQVTVSRPSDALAARAAAVGAFTGLLLGLGAVALVVGAVGIANTMIVSVLERRREIGLRRSLGATRTHIRSQFLAESVLLSLLGGGAGTLLGAVVTTWYALARNLPVVVPAWAVAGSVSVTLLIGALAGIYPAMRAARLSPTVTLSTI
ncbi:ABC transporter permease [Plantactinospora sp. ZYX-F-223]|uniref:ABC transporter permease n=1 Tax=Plantactinospora sp. ZYX-F-223 TaxID=3144103 RepID=UPI0031FD5538